MRVLALAAMLVAMAWPVAAADFNIDYENYCGPVGGFQYQYSNDYTLTDSYFSAGPPGEHTPSGWIQHPTPVPRPELNSLVINFTHELRREIPNGDEAHVGVSFSTSPEEQIVEPLPRWLEVGADQTNFQAVDDCFPGRIAFHIHTQGARMTLRNPKNDPGGEGFDLSDPEAEFYRECQPLPSLNDYTPRHPMKKAPLDLPSVLARGDSIEIALKPPDGAKCVIISLPLKGQTRLGKIHAWVQFPLGQEPPLAPIPRWTWLVVACGLLVVVALVVWRLRRP